jgi:hypothetical protein
VPSEERAKKTHAKQEERGSRPEPVLVRLIREVERTIAGPVEAAVRSDEYFDLVTQLNRARSRAMKTAESITEEWLHFFNLPAATDLRRVREQLARVERQLNRVAKSLGDAGEAGDERRSQLAQLERQLAEIAKTLGADGSVSAPRTTRRRSRE